MNGWEDLRELFLEALVHLSLESAKLCDTLFLLENLWLSLGKLTLSLWYFIFFISGDWL
jgi:hypothetical protein